MTNEYDAMQSLADSRVKARQDTLRERNQQTILSEQLERQRRHSEFVHRLMNVLTVIAIAIVAYTLFHFA